MDYVLESSKELNRRLIESSEYKNYITARNNLLLYPKHMEIVDKFRKNQVLLEARRINGYNIDLSEEFALSNEYADICLISECNDFFYAEMQMLDLLRRVYSQVLEGLIIDMNFMD